MKVRDFGPKLSYLQVATSKSPAGFLTSCKVEEKVNEIIRNSKSRVLRLERIEDFIFVHCCTSVVFECAKTCLHPKHASSRI